MFPPADAYRRAAVHIGAMNTQATLAAPALSFRFATLAPPVPLLAGPPSPGRLNELDELWQAFHRTGGLATGDQLAAVMRHTVAQPISLLARWIVARQIVIVPCQGHTLVPLFQLEADFAGLRPGVAAVVRELGAVFDDWELAQWFARGNSCLGGATPAERIAGDLASVWEAARIDRYIATGG